jgi:uncharacterized repeat protein (TIGR03803 family)
MQFGHQNPTHDFSFIRVSFPMKHEEYFGKKLARPRDMGNVRLWLVGALLAALGPLATFAWAQTSYTVTTLASFSGIYGSDPTGIVLSGNTLYGTTVLGGANNDGEVFSLPVTGGTPTVLASFNYTDGDQPNPVIVSGGTLYGSTVQGGSDGDGVVFSLPLAGGTPTVLTSINGGNGSFANGPLVLSGSTLYGTALDGGGEILGIGGAEYGGYGEVFGVPVAGGRAGELASFNLTNGSLPEGGVTLSGDMLYGTTATGGATLSASSNGDGVVFSVPVTGARDEMPTVLGSFNSASGASSGAPLLLSGGTLYGETQSGVFSVPIGGGAPTLLASLAGLQGNLILSGKTLYCTTSDGVFSVPVGGGNPTNLASISGANSLVMDSSGNLYGTTDEYNSTVFELTPSSNPAPTPPVVTAVSWALSGLIWSGAGDWFPADVPTPTIDANFNSGFTTQYAVNLTEASAANNLNVIGDNVLLATNGNTLTVAGALNIGPGSGGTGALTIVADGNGNGTVSAANGVNIAVGAELSGNATIIGNVANAGTISPGTSSTPGALYIGGNYTQSPSGVLNVRVNGSSASGNFDSLQITGSATLAGNLSVTVGSGFTPTSGNSYTLLTASSITGTFNHGSNLVPVGRSFLGVNYSGNAVSVQPTDVIAFFDELASNSSPFGHTFVELSSSVGVNTFCGFYPSFTSIFAPGALGDDSGTPWNYSIAYSVTSNQFSSVINLINSTLKNPPFYSVAGFNCTSFIKKVAQTAQIQLPNTTNDEGIDAPSAFAVSLEKIGNGYTYMGGTVFFNSSVTAASAATGAWSFSDSAAARSHVVSAVTAQTFEPIDYDYSGIEQAGHNDPATLASTLGLPFDQVNLGTVNANSITGLSLNIVGADPTEDIISMNWGDGSAYQEQSLIFSHVYSPGTYTVDLLDVDDGAVHSYDMTVLVSSAPSTPIDIDITAFTPTETPNAGLVPLSPVSVVPEPTNLALACGVAWMLLTTRNRRKKQRS